MSLYIGGRKVATIGVSSAGGIISSPGATSTYVAGAKVSIHGDLVTNHGTGAHVAATVVATNNNTVLINNIKIIVHSDGTTCTHTVTA